MTGATSPTLAYVGRNPMRAVDSPMVTIVTRKVYLRPIRSPMRPKTTAPRGRTPKPAPNVARLASSAARSLPGGKKSSPKKTASEPSVPRLEARITRHRTVSSTAGATVTGAGVAAITLGRVSSASCFYLRRRLP